MDQRNDKNPKFLVGERGSNYIFNIFQNPPEDESKNVNDVIKTFQNDYLKLPSLTSFSFPTYHHLSSKYLKIPVSETLLPLFQTLKKELLDPTRTPTPESIDLAIDKILPYSNLPMIRPIFFSLLRRSSNPSKYHFVLQRSKTMLEQCPRNVLLRIWIFKKEVFEKYFLKYLSEYLEIFEDERRIEFVGGETYYREYSIHSPNIRRSQKNDVVFDLLKSIQNNKVLISRIYEILRDLFLHPPVTDLETDGLTDSKYVVFNKNKISHFFYYFLRVSKIHPNFEIFKSLFDLFLASDDEEEDYLTDELYKDLKKVNSKIQNFVFLCIKEGEVSELRDFLVDLRIIIERQKNLILQNILNYCIILPQDPLIHYKNYDLINKINNNNNNNKDLKLTYIYRIGDNLLFNNPNSQLPLLKKSFPSQNNEKMKDEETEGEEALITEEKKEENNENNIFLLESISKDSEIWYILKSFFSFLFFNQVEFNDNNSISTSINFLFFYDPNFNNNNNNEKEKYKEILYFVITKLQILVSIDDRNEQQEIQKIINEVKLKLLESNDNENNENNNDNKKIENMFDLMFLHFCLFLLIERKVNCFTEFWNTQIFQKITNFPNNKNLNSFSNPNVHIKLDLLSQINLEFCRMLRMEKNEYFFKNFENEVIREFVIEFLWKIKSIQEFNNNENNEKEISVNRRENELNERLCIFLFINIMKEYSLSAISFGSSEEISVFFKNMKKEIERRGNECNNSECKKILKIVNPQNLVN